MLRSAAFLALVVAAAAGCGPVGPRRCHLEGKVTHGGEPVPSGLIRFEPDLTKGNDGPVGYAEIKDGRYTTATAGNKGALQGPIVAYVTGGPAPDPRVEFPQLWLTNFHTTLTLEPSRGVTIFDIDVPKHPTQTKRLKP